MASRFRDFVPGRLILKVVLVRHGPDLTFCPSLLAQRSIYLFHAVLSNSTNVVGTPTKIFELALNCLATITSRFTQGASCCSS